MSETFVFPAGRAAGLARLSNFADSAGKRYATRRNSDFGPLDRSNVSMLSPYVRHRLVTETEILEQILRRHTLDSANKFIEEVFWRTYFKGWLEHRPAVWADYRQDVAALAKKLEDDAQLRDSYEAALASCTGIDCFDAWMTELLDIGYLHNHARMWFASIWVFTLGLPWQLGADLFYRNLVDGDPASNTLSWRWVTGLHTKGKTYLARASNIAAYTDNRFGPDKALASSAPPLFESRKYVARTLPAAGNVRAGERIGLLITEEDCSPETLKLTAPPQHVIAAVATDARSPFSVGKPARQFALAAVLDALDRSQQYYGVHGEVGQSGDWGKMLTEWASRQRLDAIVTAYVPVGPVAEQLALARLPLQEQGIRLLPIRRDYDSVAWPHASNGYFKLKSRIPDILTELALAPGTDVPKQAGG